MIYFACLPLLTALFSFYPLSCGVSGTLNMQLQVLGWICTELPPKFTTGNVRSSSVRHHGEQAQFWGVNKKLTWMKMRMGDLNISLVFSAMMSAMQQDCQV